MITVADPNLTAAQVALAAAEREIAIALDAIEAARRNLIIAGRPGPAGRLATAHIYARVAHEAIEAEARPAAQAADAASGPAPF
jgi:hypothetical protein